MHRRRSKAWTSRCRESDPLPTQCYGHGRSREETSNVSACRTVLETSNALAQPADAPDSSGGGLHCDRYCACHRRIISQSGSIALILSEDERDLGFAYLITAGNEAVLNIPDYLAELAVDDRVEVILLFSETICDPQKFQAAALKARERGKRIIALKLGSSSEGRALVQAHTGSLAGEDRLYDAYLGLVRLNLASARQVEDAFADLSKRLAK